MAGKVGRPRKEDKLRIRANNVAKSINDPIFNEFLYTVLWEASYEEKRGLQGKYLKAVMSAKAAKHFIDSATEDEKSYLLAHFGIRCFKVFVKEDTVNRERLTEIMKKFHSKHRIESFKDIAEAKIFVSSDKTFNKLLGVMAQSMHSPAYYQNLEYLRAGYHIQKWSKLMINRKDMETREVLECSVALSKIVLAGNLRMNVVSGLTGVSDTEMQILLYFYSYWTMYISFEAVRDYFYGLVSQLQYSKALHGLHKSGHLEKHAEDQSYTITSSGIRIVDNYLKDVMITSKQDQ